jgi:ribose 5-phosphate isomerase A
VRPSPTTPKSDKRAAAEKQAAAEAAADLVESGMTVGLGTGTTVAFLIPALAARGLDIRCVATSPRTEAAAVEMGLRIEPFERFEKVDLAIDGADQISPAWWLVKGGGGAHTREKLVAAAAGRFVVIADSSKEVDLILPPVPLELLAFGLTSTLARLQSVRLRPVEHSPDGGIIADYIGEVDDPAALAARLSAAPGVVEHGLFPPDMVSGVIVAGPGGVRFGERPPRSG